MKTYVLTVSEKFPATHKRAGEETNFVGLIGMQKKIHTIRGNYDLWKKRFEKIEFGEAVLSVRVWTGKPYNSLQEEIHCLGSIDEIGIQKVEFDDWLYTCLIDGKRVSFSSERIAENDGLTQSDFEEWFKNSLTPEPKAIIHFTKFRY